MQALEALLKQWPGEEVIIRFDRSSGAWIFIAIYSTRLGPAGGGTRLKVYPDTQAALQDAMKLAEGMAYKFAVSNSAMGGGKAVIAIPPDFKAQARPDLLRRYGGLVQQLGGLFVTGPDVGTSATDMDIIAEVGAPYVFGRSTTSGGTGLFTAHGLFTGLKVTCAQVFGSPSLAGKTILVQGIGSVGQNLIPLLRQAGAEILFSDIDAGVCQQFRDESDLRFIAPDAVYDTECDIFVPCALGGGLNKETIPRLRCRAVVGAANNQLANPEDARRLQARQIFYAPDFVVNFGGAMAIIGLETEGWSQDEAKTRVSQSIQEALSQVFALAAQKGVTTEIAARHLAEARLVGTKDCF